MLSGQNRIVEVFEIIYKRPRAFHQPLRLIAFVVDVEVALILSKPTLVRIGNIRISGARYDDRILLFRDIDY